MLKISFERTFVKKKFCLVSEDQTSVCPIASSYFVYLIVINVSETPWKSSIRRSNVLFKPKSFRRRLDRKNQPRHAYALFQPESTARARIGSDNRIGSIRIRPRPLSYCAITSIPFGIPLAKSQLVPRSNSECIRPVCIFSLHKGDSKGKNCSMANSSLTSGSL